MCSPRDQQDGQKPHATPPSTASAFFLVGPTASGKSAVAQFLAEQEGRTIVSADSMLVYRGMNIGTAKPTAEQQRRVPYVGLDLVNPGSTFSVGRYLKEVAAAFRSLCPGEEPIVVGGTGLYIKCLTEGLSDSKPVDEKNRARLEAIYRRDGVAGLQAILRRMAPRRLEALQDPRNPRRLIRAIELAQQEVAPRCTWSGPPAPPLVGLRPAPGYLKTRIIARVEKMFRDGLLDEAAALRHDHPEFSGTARHAIGYAEALAVLDHQYDIEEARARIVQRTWQLARRQMTWFRHQLRVAWVDVEDEQPVEVLAGRVRELWRQHGPTPVVLPR